MDNTYYNLKIMVKRVMKIRIFKLLSYTRKYTRERENLQLRSRIFKDWSF